MRAFRGLKTVREIAAEFEVHPVMVSNWKKEMLQHLLRALVLPSNEVILNYGRFLFSFQGLEVWVANIKFLTNQGITILCSPACLTILFTTSFVSLAIERVFALTPLASMGRRRILQHCVHVLLFPVLYLLAPDYGHISLLVYCTVLLVASY